MMRYKVTITETLEMEVEVNAKSRAEAEQKIEARWHNGEYILDAECFSRRGILRKRTLTGS